MESAHFKDIQKKFFPIDLAILFWFKRHKIKKIKRADRHKIKKYIENGIGTLSRHTKEILSLRFGDTYFGRTVHAVRYGTRTLQLAIMDSGGQRMRGWAIYLSGFYC